jgi:hypothetical protein
VEYFNKKKHISRIIRGIKRQSQVLPLAVKVQEGSKRLPYLQDNKLIWDSFMDPFSSQREKTLTHNKSSNQNIGMFTKSQLPQAAQVDLDGWHKMGCIARQASNPREPTAPW